MNVENVVKPPQKPVAKKSDAEYGILPLNARAVSTPKMTEPSTFARNVPNVPKKKIEFKCP